MIATIKKDETCCLCRKKLQAGDKITISGPWLSDVSVRDCPELIINRTSGNVCPQCRKRLGSVLVKTISEIIKESEASGNV